MSIIPMILGAIFGWFFYDWLNEKNITIHYEFDHFGVIKKHSELVSFFELMSILISRKVTISRKFKIIIRNF